MIMEPAPGAWRLTSCWAPQDRFPGRTHPGIVLLFGLLVFRSLAWRKLSKSAAPGGRGKLWLLWEDGWCRLTSRGKTNSSTCDVSPFHVEVLHHRSQSGSSGSHCPRMTRRLIVPLCFLPWCGSSDPGHKLALWWVGGWGGRCPAGPPAVPLWAGRPSQVQAPTTSPGKTSELVVTRLPW